MDGRSTLAVVALALARAANAATYTNPVLSGDVPDPGVIALPNGSGWLAATTGGAPGSGYFPLHSSLDLAAWTPRGFAVDRAHWPSWADATAWAPEVHEVDVGHYVLYFASRLASTSALVVGASASTTGPMGPFVASSAPLVVAPSGSCFGVIDPTYFRDTDTGQRFVVYKHDGNSCGKPTDILAAPLSADGLTVVGAATLLITNDPASWEGGVTEAPWVMRNGSTLYLFYSGAVYDQPSYAIGVARSVSGLITGPFEKFAGNPVLRSAPGAGNGGSPLHFGPGHCSVVSVGGEWAFVYAAEQPGGGVRNLMLDAIVWTSDGWPVAAHGGVPSNTSEPIPGV